MEQLEINTRQDTVAAVSTPSGAGGIAVVRVSGPQALDIVNKAWQGKDLSKVPSHTAHLGRYISIDGNILDEAVALIFRAPSSFTGEDTVEISIHGSKWIQREIIHDLTARGARPATNGEFTQRAFMNGRLDLAQAEGIADLIAANSKAAHAMAVSQTRGFFSRELESMRSRLVDLASLLELELDFSEEDVEFADRSKLNSLADETLAKIDRLANSYSSGAVLKEGVPVVIAGVPNAGKSSLLNHLLGDDKAIVSDIPGTTRDSIEDTAEINGILFRFIDTAGLRATSDTVESLGIDRARMKMRQARVVVWLIDPTSPLPPQTAELSAFIAGNPDSDIITVVNKSDLQVSPLRLSPKEDSPEITQRPEDATAWNLISEAIRISAKTGEGTDTLLDTLTLRATGGQDPAADLIVTNARHYEALVMGGSALRRAKEGIATGLSADFIAQDIREALAHLGAITGAITTDTLLHTIFSRFCIGK